MYGPCKQPKHRVQSVYITVFIVGHPLVEYVLPAEIGCLDVPEGPMPQHRGDILTMDLIRCKAKSCVSSRGRPVPPSSGVHT